LLNSEARILGSTIARYFVFSAAGHFVSKVAYSLSLVLMSVLVLEE